MMLGWLEDAPTGRGLPRRSCKRTSKPTAWRASLVLLRKMRVAAAFPFHSSLSSLNPLGNSSMTPELELLITPPVPAPTGLRGGPPGAVVGARVVVGVGLSWAKNWGTTPETAAVTSATDIMLIGRAIFFS